MKIMWLLGSGMVGRIPGTRLHETYKDFHGAHTVVYKNLALVHMNSGAPPNAR